MREERYKSNSDIDLDRSRYNLHLIRPAGKYRVEAERRIAEAGCRTRKDSVRVVEALVTASPEFFTGKKPAEIKTFFEDALHFIEKHQARASILSAVVHMDEKTPHMHLSFVPLTPDKRLSAKEIVGNKKKLTWWQDQFWKYMVKRYPDLERGEVPHLPRGLPAERSLLRRRSASLTGRDHIPPRVFKETAHLSREFDDIQKTMAQITPFNSKAKTAEVRKMLERFAPRYEDYLTLWRKYDATFKKLKADNIRLAREARDNKDDSIRHQLEINEQLAAYENLRRNVERYAPELLGRQFDRGKHREESL